MSLGHLASGLVGAVLMVSWGACSEPPWPRVVPEPAPAEAPARVDAGVAAAPVEVAAPTLELSPGAIDKLAPMLAANDKLHAALSGDTLEGVGDLGVAIAESALAARPLITDATASALLADIETRGRRLGQAGDIEATRLAYGELSKPLVALAAGVPGLRGGRHVFMCPMAKGYQKWLQPEPSLRNPYFGAKMLTCGEESTWAP